MTSRLDLALLLFLFTPWLLVHSAPDDVLRYELVEERPPGTVIIQDIATEAGFRQKYSKDIVNRLRYTLFSQLPPSNTSLFMIDAEKGRLTTAVSIDRDTICRSEPTCLLVLQMAVQEPYFQIVKIEIKLVDINDNAPAFNPPYLQASLTESQSPGDLFPVPLATDADSPAHSVQQYRLITTASDPFELRVDQGTSGVPDLKLVLTKELDHEMRDRFLMHVVAVDGGRPQLTGTLTIELTITDENDNSPRFTKSMYNVTIKEDEPIGKVMVTVSAVDLDSGSNGKVKYSLSDRTIALNPGMFTVNAETGEVILSRGLDAEQQKTYLIIILAEDYGSNPLASSASVIVSVTDVNDNVPLITVDALSNLGQMEVAYGVPRGVPVAYVTVTDPDEGEAGHVTCRLDRDSDDDFELEQIMTHEYYLVTTRAFQRDHRLLEMPVLISCRDNGDPRLSSDLHISVKLVEYEEVRPVFKQALYERDLLENNEIGEHVVTVSAEVDKDSAIGTVLYRLGENETRFHVDARTGVLTAAMRFDREAAPIVELYVEAYFESEFQRLVERNSQFKDGSSVRESRVKKHLMVDIEEDYRITDKIQRSRRAVRTDSDGGRSGRYPQRKANFYPTRHGDLPSTSTPRSASRCLVRVNVLDVDDNVPLFTNQTYSFNVSKTLPLRHLIGQVKAIDLDEWPFNQTWYHIEKNATDKDCFEIGLETGMLTTSCYLAKHSVDTFTIRVRSFTNGVSVDGPVWVDEAVVYVYIRDLVNGVPVLDFQSRSNATLRLLRSVLGPGEVVAVIQPHRGFADGLNSHPTYTLMNANRHFHVEPETGEVILTQLPKSTNSTVSFRLEIQIGDNRNLAPGYNVSLLVVIEDDTISVSPQTLSSKSGEGVHVFVLIAIIGSVTLLSIIIVIVCSLILCQHATGGKVIKKTNKKKNKQKKREAVEDDEDEQDREAKTEESLNRTESVPVTPSLTEVPNGILNLDAEPVNYAARHRWHASCEKDSDSLCTEMSTSMTSCGSTTRDGEKVDANGIRTPYRYYNSAYLYRANLTWPRRSQCLDSPTAEELPPPPSPICLRDLSPQPKAPPPTKPQRLWDPHSPSFNGTYVGFEKIRPVMAPHYDRPIPSHYERPMITPQFERTTTFGVKIPATVSSPAATSAPDSNPICRVPRTFSTNGSLSDCASDKPLVKLGNIPPPMSLQRTYPLTNDVRGMTRSASQTSRKSVRFVDNEENEI